MSVSPGVADMARVLRTVKHMFDLDSVSGSRRLPNGHVLTLRWSGDSLAIEREDGETMVIDPARLG